MGGRVEASVGVSGGDMIGDFDGVAVGDMGDWVGECDGEILGIFV